MSEKIIPSTPKLPDWPVYDYENLPNEIEVWHKIIDFHLGNEPSHYLFGRADNHLIIYEKSPFAWANKILYSQKEYPLSVGKWFVDALQNKYWKPAEQGGLGPWKDWSEHINGEEIALIRGMALGGPGIGGYSLCNFSRKGHSLVLEDRPKPMLVNLHDILLQDIGMYGFFLDLKKWYEAEQATGIKKPLYPKVPNLGQLEISHLPEKATLLKTLDSLDKPGVKDYFISWGDYLIIVSLGEDYFNQVEIPKQALSWIVDTVEKLFVKGENLNNLSRMETFAPSIVIGDTEQIRLTNGLGQVSLGGTRFRLMNLNRTSYTDALMAQEYDLFYGHFTKHDMGYFLRNIK